MVAADQRAKMSPQRTISLGSLHHPPQTQFMEPRLSQLETLEAKMASIEVSLSTTLKKTKKSSTPVIPNSPQPTMITQKTVTPVKGNGYMTDNHDKENIARNNIKLQTHLVNETNEQNKHNQKVQSDTVNESEKYSLTQKIESLKNDMDQKRLAIKNIKMSLEQLDVTDNIDTRIQQAELEYQLGREELNLLSLMEETNKHKCRLEEIEQYNEQNENNTLYNYLVSNPGAVISLQAVELEYDPKSPKFGVGSRKDKPGLFIDWTVDNLGFSKEDRLLEVNGKVVLSMKNNHDLNRLLEVSPSSVRVVVMHDGPSAGHQLELATLRRELDACRTRAETDRSKRLQDGKREAVAQGVVPGGPGVGADQGQVVVRDSVEWRRWRQRRNVPERRQLGSDGPEQEPQTRRVGHPTVQAQTGGVRRPARGGAGPRRRPGGQDAHPDRAPAVRLQFGVRRVTGVVGRRRGGRLQVFRRPARRGRRGARQAEQVPDGRRPEQQQDPTHTRGPADVVPVPRLRVFRGRRCCAVFASAVRRRQREVARLAAGRDGRRLAPVEEHRILLALDRNRCGITVGRWVAASQPVAQLRFGTVGPAGPDAAQETVAAVVAAATLRQ
ncbi:uncharacterized protein LOC112602709 isoform X2 [Melanaphis sacchari]|nr:uncharacterized protein LOC112602709 isoform X2 [Melanaphis sacchari]